MTVIDVNFATRQRGTAPLIRSRFILTDASRWHHPAWCTDCAGGEIVADDNGVDMQTVRYHRNITFDRAVNDISDGTADIRVETVAFEDADGFHDEPVVVIDAGRLNVDADTAEEFAHAILAAVAYARQPLPATDRAPIALEAS